jgi:DNA-binding CsgD family transcriptional regulator
MSGFIARKVIESFRRPAAGSSAGPLSARENEILHLLAEGLSDKEIANRLAISPHTVHKHVRAVYDKLHVHSRAQAVARYLQARGPSGSPR